jgi:cobalt-precorrin 5A hydrolase/precorrin-3B C17-methyltransferase
VAAAIGDPEAADAQAIESALRKGCIAPAALAAIAVAEGRDVPDRLLAAARRLGAEVRIVPSQDDLAAAIVNAERVREVDGITLYRAAAPLAVALIGRPVGRLSLVGLGPGDAASLTGAAHAALEAAENLVGYATYLDLVPPLGRAKRRHASGNRVELDRACEALDLASEGRRVALVTSGDPGIFAMAAAVMEALEAAPGRWTGLEIEVVPGVSAMQTAAARLGAPLGHDFCAISLSDIRKPWEIIEGRLAAAGEANLVVALYNPASKTRRDQIAKARDILLRYRRPETPVVVGRNLGRDGEETEVVALGDLDPAQIDMRTVLIVGSSRSRTFRGPGGRLFAYAPRSHEET